MFRDKYANKHMIYNIRILYIIYSSIFNLSVVNCSSFLRHLEDVIYLTTPPTATTTSVPTTQIKTEIILSDNDSLMSYLALSMIIIFYIILGIVLILGPIIGYKYYKRQKVIPTNHSINVKVNTDIINRQIENLDMKIDKMYQNIDSIKNTNILNTNQIDLDRIIIDQNNILTNQLPIKLDAINLENNIIINELTKKMDSINKKNQETYHNFQILNETYLDKIIETIQSVNSDQLKQSTQSVNTVQSTQSVNTAQSTQSVNTVQSTQSVNTVQSNNLVDLVESKPDIDNILEKQLENTNKMIQPILSKIDKMSEQIQQVNTDIKTSDTNNKLCVELIEKLMSETLEKASNNIVGTNIEDIKLIMHKSISENMRSKEDILNELRNISKEETLKELITKQTNIIKKMISEKKPKEDLDQEKIKHIIGQAISDLDNVKTDKLGNILTEQSPKLILNCNKPTEIKSNKTVLTDNIDGNNLTISQEVKINKKGIDVSVNTLNNGQMIHETLKFNIESDRENIFENRISESEIDLQCKAKF